VGGGRYFYTYRWGGNGVCYPRRYARIRILLLVTGLQLFASHVQSGQLRNKRGELEAIRPTLIHLKTALEGHFCGVGRLNMLPGFELIRAYNLNIVGWKRLGRSRTHRHLLGFW
jgi:hypothetical protein